MTTIENFVKKIQPGGLYDNFYPRFQKNEGELLLSGAGLRGRNVELI